MSSQPRAVTFAALLCLTLLALLPLTAPPVVEAAPAAVPPPAALPPTSPLQPSIPLPENCGGTLPDGTCCVRGFVYFQGRPVWGAEVTIGYPQGVTETFTTTYSLLHGLPHYAISFPVTGPHPVTRGDTITLTARYAGLTVTRIHQMSQLSHQIDLTFTTTTRVSLPSISESNQASRQSSLSHDGALVVFTSDADNLVTGDTNGKPDIFVHDRRTGVTRRVSVHSNGTQSNGVSYSASISGDGKVIAFVSQATNLIDEDTNNKADVFVHILATQETTRISISETEEEGSGSQALTALSYTGQFVIFHSYSTDLVPGDTNGMADVFRYDRLNGTVELVSRTPDDRFANEDSHASTISRDGQFVAFFSKATNLVEPNLPSNEHSHIYLRDMRSESTILVSVNADGIPGFGNSDYPYLSGDGRFISFRSEAQNLTPHPHSGNRSDIYLWERETGALTRITALSETRLIDGNSYGGAISDDGQKVLFHTNDPWLDPTDGHADYDVFLYDHGTRQIQRLSLPYTGTESPALSEAQGLSGDGKRASFFSLASDLVPSDTNGVQDLFVRELATAVTTRVALPDPTIQASLDSEHPDMSADSRWVVFTSPAPNLAPGNPRGKINVFRRDRATGETTLVSAAPDGTPGNGHSLQAAISDDGRWVVFLSRADNLVSGDSNGTADVFLRDMEGGVTRRLSLNSQGQQVRASFTTVAISGDGKWVAFSSDAETLVPGDGNGKWDVFLHEVATMQTERISRSALGVPENGSSYEPAFSPGEGRFVVFQSAANNLVAGDNNPASDIFLWDREGSSLERVSLPHTASESNGPSSDPVVSADGRYVAFASQATTLVDGDTNQQQDIFVRDRTQRATYRVSVSSTGIAGNGRSAQPSISDNGQIIAFQSHADNLVRPDSANPDIFVHNLVTKQTTILSRLALQEEGAGNAQEPVISGDGRYVSFASTSSTLVPNDTNGVKDIFVVDGGNGEIPIPPAIPHDEWVLMFYLAGDNDLAEQMEQAVSRLADVAADHPHLTLVALVDGAGPNDTHHLTFQGEAVTIVHLPERDMGISETLESFVHATFSLHPASHYYLNIADHGRGTTGIAWDTQQLGRTSYLEPRELHDALLAATGEGQRLDILHLDACLMDLLEVAYDASNYADYLIASQYLAWAPFQFDGYARAAGRATAPVDLARAIVRRYHHTLEVAPAGPLVHTIAAVDLAHMPRVQGALDSLLTALEDASDGIATVTQARAQSQKFPSRAPYDQIPQSAEYLDLADFSAHLTMSTDSTVAARAQTLVSLIQNAIVEHYHRSPNPHTVPPASWNLDRSNGLSIYFPPAPGGAEYEAYRTNGLFTFTRHSRWDEFIADYYIQAAIPPQELEATTLPPVQIYQQGYQLYLPHIAR